MPQFDIASFFPQIVFFASLFLLFYAFLVKNALPKISQNLKLNKKIMELLISSNSKDKPQDINLLSYIYNPNNLLSNLIYKESLCLVFLRELAIKVTSSYIACLNWLTKNNEKNIKIRLLKLNRIYFNILNDIYYGRS